MKLAFKIPVAAIAAGLMSSGMALAQPTAASTAPDIEPEAVEALKRMSTYLRTLPAFEVTSDNTFDITLQDGQNLQFGERAVTKARRPDGFVIERTSEYKDRRFYYDGKKLTVYSPRTSYYAQVDAPPTIKETLTAVSDRYGIDLPLTDLFRWSEPGDDRIDDLQTAQYVGKATIGGVRTDHYAFRQKDVDWQIWIAEGASPVPRRVVIVNRADEARPQYTANMTWNTKPAYTNATFAFQPPANALPIKLTALGQ